MIGTDVSGGDGIAVTMVRAVTGGQIGRQTHGEMLNHTDRLIDAQIDTYTYKHTDRQRQTYR